MDGHPAVVAIDDRSADHPAAAHGIFDEVEMNRVTAKDALLPQMREPRVADPASAELMVDRVAADALRIGALDDHIAREIGDFAAQLARAEVNICKRPIERERHAVDLRDDALLGLQLLTVDRPSDDHLIADAPSRHRLGERDGRIVRLHIRAELHPCAAHRRAVQIHPRRAGADRRRVVLAHPIEVVKTDARRELRRDRLVERPHHQRSGHTARQRIRLPLLRHRVQIAPKAALRAALAILHFQQADVQRGAAVPRKAQLTRDLDEANHLFALTVINHARLRADQHPLPLRGHPRRLPSPRIGPRTVAHGFDVEAQRLRRRRLGAHRCVKDSEGRDAEEEFRVHRGTLRGVRQSRGALPPSVNNFGAWRLLSHPGKAPARTTCGSGHSAHFSKHPVQ